MSAEPVLEVVDPEERPHVAASPDPLARTRTWPATLLASCASSLALAAALAAPLVSLSSLAGAVVAAPSVLLAAFIARLTFDSRSVRARGRLSWRVAVSAMASAALAVATVCGAAVVAGADLGLAPVAASFGLTALVLVVAGALRAMEVRYLRASRRVFLVATEEQRRDIAREIRRHEGMELVGFWNVTGVSAAPGLAAQVEAARATMMVLSTEAGRREDVVAAAARFNRAGGRVRDLAGFYERHFHKVPLSELTESWFLFDVAGIHRARAYGACKRGAEIAIAAVLLTLTVPLLLTIALCVRLSGPGPVFFRQQRVGRNRDPFTLLKFRTMRLAGADDAPGWADEHAHRVTRVGGVLRRFRLDELPQFWNVLRGDMSLVGPRPEQLPLVDRLGSQIDYYDARHVVRPGVTGWAQVNHGYGGSHQGTLEKLQYDFFYIRHQGLRLDALVLARTARAVVAGSGAHAVTD